MLNQSKNVSDIAYRMFCDGYSSQDCDIEKVKNFFNIDGIEKEVQKELEALENAKTIKL